MRYADRRAEKREKRNYYYWIITRDTESGKPYLLPGGRTEDEAHQKGLEQLAGTDFEVKRLPTTNMDAASRMVKGGQLEKTHDLHKSVQRMGRTKSFLRRKRKGDF